MSNQFPDYIKAFFPKSLIPLEFNLGEHAHDLRFTVTIDPVTTTKPLLILHAGPTAKGQVLAVAKKPKRYHDDYKTVVQIVAPTVNTPAQGQHNTTAAVMIGRHNLAYRRYQFSVKLGSRIEMFEWRSTSGNEVREMFNHPRGFKLIRMGSEGPGGGRGGQRATRTVGESSDGKEVVAVWATERSLISKGLVPLGNKPFKFELRGSGKTAELGHQFAYLAVITALKIWLAEAQRISGIGMMDSFTHG